MRLAASPRSPAGVKRVRLLADPRWQAVGALVGIISAIVAVLEFTQSWGPDRLEPTSPGPAVTFTYHETPSPTPTPASSVIPDISRVAYLTQAERICLQDRRGVPALPDRNSDPAAFGRWLRDIATGNQILFDKLIGLKRPRADETLLGNLYAQRQHANDLYLRAASAFETNEPATGEQFLNNAMAVEADFRDSAKGYGFTICVGSDAPGR